MVCFDWQVCGIEIDIAYTRRRPLCIDVNYE